MSQFESSMRYLRTAPANSSTNSGSGTSPSEEVTVAVGFNPRRGNPGSRRVAERRPEAGGRIYQGISRRSATFPPLLGHRGLKATATFGRRSATASRNSAKKPIRPEAKRHGLATPLSAPASANFSENRLQAWPSRTISSRRPHMHRVLNRAAKLDSNSTRPLPNLDAFRPKLSIGRTDPVALSIEPLDGLVQNGRRLGELPALQERREALLDLFHDRRWVAAGCLPFPKA